MTLTEIITAIASGDADENLTAVYEAFKDRSRIVRAQKQSINRLTIVPGTRVRLVGLRPKWLNGREGVVVVGSHRTRITVQLDVPAPGYGLLLHAPATAVESI